MTRTKAKGLKPYQLRQAIEALGMTQAAFAAELARLSGLKVAPSYISEMCADREGSKPPSPLASAVASLMLENIEAQRLKRAIERLGYRKG